MNTSYELTADDLIAFTLFHHVQSPALRQQRIGCLIGVELALLVLPGLVFLASDKPFLQTAKAIWPLLAGPTLFLPFVILYSRWKLVRLTRRMLPTKSDAELYSKRSLSLEADGLRECTAMGETFRNWGAVVKFVITKKHFFIYTSEIEAFIVPLRAFPTPDEALAFQQRIAVHSGIEPIFS